MKSSSTLVSRTPGCTKARGSLRGPSVRTDVSDPAASASGGGASGLAPPAAASGLAPPAAASGEGWLVPPDPGGGDDLPPVPPPPVPGSPLAPAMLVPASPPALEPFVGAALLSFDAQARI